MFLTVYYYLSPVKAQYRDAIWYGSYTGASIGEKFNLIIVLNDEAKTSKGNPDLDERESMIWRYSYQLSALDLVIHNTPNPVNYWNGTSYIILSKFIPRVFWPNKPKEEMGQKFGHTYNVLDATDSGTSMNTPILAEAYMNYGYNGIPIIMFLLAFIYYILNYYLNNNSANIYTQICAVSILFPLTTHESNFTLAFGNVPLMLITIFVIVRLFKN